MNMKPMIKRISSLLLTGAVAFGCVACSSGTTQTAGNSPLNPQNPTAITIWNYYNGDQLTAFDNLVSEFNSTVGVEQGIAVTSISQGSIDNLADSLLESANGKVGSQDMPTLAAIYAETAYILDKQELLVDLDSYFTADELALYIPGFIEEGRMSEGGGLMLFPVSKSTECFAVNATDWAGFEAATGVTIDSITSYETLAAAAQTYYEWTDGLTPDVAEDGKALYGRDSVANYVYIGTTELGHEIFKVTKDGIKTEVDRDTFKKLWDNYYVPYINGYFANTGNYRSEDMKTGMILSMTGSTSGVAYLPTAVTDANDQTHDISIVVKNPLSFADGQKVAVQQGAGYCVVKSTDAQQYAAVEFLKWFTESGRNLTFSVSSGYSSVTVEGNTEKAITDNFGSESLSAKQQNILSALLVSANVYTTEQTYTCKPFDGSKAMRDVFADALTNAAVADRAAVVEAIAAGKTREEAVAPYCTDEYFDSWFNALCASVDATLA